MGASRHPHDAAEASESNVEQESPAEAPIGASDQDGSRFGEEQRQRAGAAAAYAAAQGAAPNKPTAEGGEQQGDDAGEQVQHDLDELTAKAAKADEYLMLAQRTQADFENYRKRAVREAALAQDRGVAKLAKELLPAIDNLERAVKAAGAEESQLAEGIKLAYTDLLSALQRVGVEPFSPEGEQFDPQLHEAVAQQPIEGVESGTVAEVFQQGYRLGDSVLRPARVLVAA
jgi:molecular chaperone GrpE